MLGELPTAAVAEGEGKSSAADELATQVEAVKVHEEAKVEENPE